MLYATVAQEGTGMIKENIQDALNEQINKELYSSHLYLSMSAYFESVDLAGFAHWMRIQAQEEVVHAMKMYNYINERGGRVVMKQIDAPQVEWESPLAAFEHAYEHEQFVTGLINGLVDLAEAEKDRASFNFLQWFIEEQVEEEDSASSVVRQIKLAGQAGLFILDKEMGARIFNIPPEFA